VGPRRTPDKLGDEVEFQNAAWRKKSHQGLQIAVEPGGGVMATRPARSAPGLVVRHAHPQLPLVIDAQDWPARLILGIRFWEPPPMTSDRAPFQRRRPRQSRSRATFDAILEAAAQVLERDGPAGFTTASVAERAGVSIGTLYQYFSDKQAILLAAAEREVSGEAPALASRQKVLMQALIAFLDSIGRMAEAAPTAAGRQRHARTRFGGSRLDRRIFDWDLDLAMVFHVMVRELSFEPRLQPIPARIRRRR
jgi:AcrR family transcriptional regulator